MPTVKLRVRPVHSWSSVDKTSLLQVLGSMEYEPCPSNDNEPLIRRFQSQKVLTHDLWAESNSILEGLIPRLHCLFKFELQGDRASVRRWTQVTGQPWFDSNDERF
jgi:hypothetical protein